MAERAWLCSSGIVSVLLFGLLIVLLAVGPSFMAVLPTWGFGVAFVGTCVAAAVFVTLLVRRAPWFGGAAESAEFIGLMYPMIGAIYGVVLAFTIVLSWERFAEADTHTASEVTRLSSLWRNSQVFGPVAEKDIEQRLCAYANSVVDQEWESLANSGEEHDDTIEAYEGIWEFYRDLLKGQGHTGQEPLYYKREFYEAALRQLNELGIERRQRIMAATSEVSATVWVFLCLGGIVTVVIPMAFWTKSGFVQLAVNGTMAFIVAFSLWIIASLQFPYSGDVSVSNEPFIELIRSFKERQDEDCVCKTAILADERCCTPQQTQCQD